MRKRDEQVIARRFLAGEFVVQIMYFDAHGRRRADSDTLRAEDVEDILRRRLKQQQWKEAP